MKKSDFKLMIRKMVREEVAMAIQEVITELKQPTQQVSKPKPKKKMVEKKSYTSNSILNDVLNETANDEWKTMGGGTYTTNDMGNVLKNQYGDLMSNKEGVNPDAMIASMGTNPNSVPDSLKDKMCNKDYSKVLKAMDEKSKQNRPVK